MIETKYILKQIHGDSELTYEFKEESLNELLLKIEWFLRGCSFVIDKYHRLEFVSEELPQIDEPKKKRKK